MAEVVVHPWSREDLASEYDLFVPALGYETRARYIAESIGVKAREKIAYGFQDRKVISYSANRRFFEKSGFRIEEVSDGLFSSEIERTVRTVVQESQGDIARVCVDISSFNGIRMASTIRALRQAAVCKKINVDFIYSLAAFSAPPGEDVDNRFAGPVLPEFAGWTIEPDCPPLAVVGVGYEAGKALGAVEHIQASRIWVFVPESPIKRYLHEVNKANRHFLETIPEENIFRYRVDKPFGTFASLESLTSRLVEKGSPVIFPFGPKVFGLCALLVACLYQEVAVWRVSAGSAGKPVNRKPSGHVFGVRAVFSPNCD